MSGSSPSAAQLGRAIRRLRNQRDLSIEGLAGEADIHATYLWKIENGRRNPTWNVVGRLAVALGLDLSALARVAEDVADGEDGERGRT